MFSHPEPAVSGLARFFARLPSLSATGSAPPVSPGASIVVTGAADLAALDRIMPLLSAFRYSEGVLRQSFGSGAGALLVPLDDAPAVFIGAGAYLDDARDLPRRELKSVIHNKKCPF